MLPAIPLKKEPYQQKIAAAREITKEKSWNHHKNKRIAA
jgi:hypothetical protein